MATRLGGFFVRTMGVVGVRGDGLPPNGCSPTPPERSPLTVRARAAVRRAALDRQLAAGVDPTGRAELAFRAASLVRHRTRKGLARSLRLVVWEAEAGAWASRASPRPVRRAEVLGCREALLALTDRLERPEPAEAEGVAIVERLLSDLRSPLFAWAEPHTIRRLARLASAALDPTPPGRDDS